MGLTRIEKAARAHQEFQRRGCTLWPLCSCHDTLAKWRDDLSDEEKIWQMDALAWAETSIFITLACVSKYCPDPAMKLYAKHQLSKRFWNRQKAMGLPMEQ